MCRLQHILSIACLIAITCMIRGAVNKERVPFSFVKKPLLTIIEDLAQKKGLNVALPTNPATREALQKQTITYKPRGKQPFHCKKLGILCCSIASFLDLVSFKMVSHLPYNRLSRPTERPLLVRCYHSLSTHPFLSFPHQLSEFGTCIIPALLKSHSSREGVSAPHKNA